MRPCRPPQFAQRGPARRKNGANMALRPAKVFSRPSGRRQIPRRRRRRRRSSGSMMFPGYPTLRSLRSASCCPAAIPASSSLLTSGSTSPSYTTSFFPSARVRSSRALTVSRILGRCESSSSPSGSRSGAGRRITDADALSNVWELGSRQLGRQHGRLCQPASNTRRHIQRAGVRPGPPASQGRGRNSLAARADLPVPQLQMRSTIRRAPQAQCPVSPGCITSV